MTLKIGFLWTKKNWRTTYLKSRRNPSTKLAKTSKECLLAGLWIPLVNLRTTNFGRNINFENRHRTLFICFYVNLKTIKLSTFNLFSGAGGQNKNTLLSASSTQKLISIQFIYNKYFTIHSITLRFNLCVPHFTFEGVSNATYLLYVLETSERIPL